MGKFKKAARALLRAFGPVGLLIGAIATGYGAFQAVSGGEGLWSLSPSEITTLGLVLVAIFGAITILRHEMILLEVDELIGNEHARKLYSDGIPPFRDEYLRYVRQGDYAVVNRFWRAGFVNLTDSNGRSDLHIACERGHSAIADGIIRNGGDAKRPDSQGITPLMLAAIEGHTKVVETLLLHDCALNSKSANHGVSALFIAAAHGRQAVIEILLRAGAEIDSLDHNNLTPLIAAITQRKWDVASSVLEAGAATNRVTASGATVLDHALAFGAPSGFVKKLKDAGATVSKPRLKQIGGGFSRVGHIRIHWEHERQQAKSA